METGANNNFPLEMKDVPQDQAEHLMKYFTGMFMFKLQFYQYLDL